MDRDDIRRVVQSHAEACRRSLDAGFDICEIHGAHGYVIQQFLSPITNRRNDGYGGDLAGRMRFCLEVIEAAREAWPKDRPLFFRASCVDGKGGAWQIEDTVALARELKLRGVDVVDCSSGGIEGPLTLAVVPRVPGYHVPFAERVRREAEIPTMAVGLITEARRRNPILPMAAAIWWRWRAKCCGIRTGPCTPPRRWAAPIRSICFPRPTRGGCAAVTRFASSTRRVTSRHDEGATHETVRGGC